MSSEPDFASKLETNGWKRSIAGDDFDLGLRIANALYRNPGKGLVLSGPFGSGKTSFIRALFKGCLKTLILPMDELLLDPECDFDPCTGNVLIDDVGAEHTMNSYGVKSERFADFVLSRHLLQKSGRLLITTNLTTSEFDVRYGGRVVSRLKDLCFAAKFTGQDKREWQCIR